MPSDGTQSAENSILQTLATTIATHAKAVEAILANQQEADERQARIEMALMRDAAVVDVEHSGATGRLDKAALERAHIRAAIARIEKNLLQFLVEFDTFRRETRRNESLLTQMWRAWRALREGNE